MTQYFCIVLVLCLMMCGVVFCISEEECTKQLKLIKKHSNYMSKVAMFCSDCRANGSPFESFCRAAMDVQAGTAFMTMVEGVTKTLPANGTLPLYRKIWDYISTQRKSVNEQTPFERVNTVYKMLCAYWPVFFPFVVTSALALVTSSAVSFKMTIKLLITFNALVAMYSQGEFAIIEIVLCGIIFMMLCLATTFGVGERAAIAFQFAAVLIMLLSLAVESRTSIGIAFIVIVMYFYAMLRSIRDSTSRESTSVVIHLSTFYGLVLAIQRLYVIYSVQNAATKLLYYFISSVIPVGEHITLFWNVATNAVKVLEYVKRTYKYDINVALVPVIFFFIFSFIVFRACVGYLSIRRLYQNGCGVYNFSLGLYVYMVDVFCFMRIFTSVHSGNKRLIIYDTLSVLLMLIEIFFAIDFFCFRLIFVAIDVLFLGSANIGRVRMLAHNVKFLSAFPQSASKPFMDVEALLDKTKNVVTVRAKNTQGLLIQGKGYIFQRGTTWKLATVEHVVSGTHIEHIMDRNGVECSINCDWRTLTKGKGADPIIIVQFTFVKEDEPAFLPDDLKILNLNDLGNVKQHIVVIGRSLNVLNPMEYQPKTHTYKCRVNLKTGDSGAPVFAMDKFGIMSYVGAVSAGSRDEHHGNVVSAIFSKVEHGSPGNSNNIVVRPSIKSSSPCAEVLDRIINLEALDVRPNDPNHMRRTEDRAKDFRTVLCTLLNRTENDPVIIKYYDGFKTKSFIQQFNEARLFSSDIQNMFGLVIDIEECDQAFANVIHYYMADHFASSQASMVYGAGHRLYANLFQKALTNDPGLEDEEALPHRGLGR